MTSALRITRDTTNVVRGRPPRHMFVPLTEQVANIRRWNTERGWGLDAADLDTIDLVPRWHADPLVVDLIAVYLDRREPFDEMDGIRRTCHELWTVAAARQPHSWSWDWRQDRYEHQPKPVQLLPGMEHRPGVRRVTVDLGAHWAPGQHIRPRHLRGPDSAHAELLAAAAHFPRWIQSMDGVSVPFVWLSGYQMTYPAYATDSRLPGLAWVHYRSQMSITVNWADRTHAGWASPVRIRAELPHWN
jgi:hypothetical protein